MSNSQGLLVDIMGDSMSAQKHDLIMSLTPNVAYILEGFTYDQLTQIQRFVKSFDRIERDLYSS